MPSDRTGYAPWSLTREAGVQSATVDGTIKVPQNLQPVLDTGFIDEKGNWKGVKSSDEVFTVDPTHEGVANGGVVFSPQKAEHDFIDMTGFSSLFVAINPSNGGNFAMEAVMGVDTTPFANLIPVRANVALRGNLTGESTFSSVLADSAESLATDGWNIFRIQTNLADQKNLQFKITNNSGGASDITFAYMRVV